MTVINGEKVIATEEMTLPAAPPKHLSVRREIVGVNPVTTITWRKFDATVVCAIPMVFGILCIFFGLPGGPVLEKGFSFKAFAANIPFLLFIGIMACGMIFQIAGKKTLTLSRGKGIYFEGVGRIGSRKHFEYGRNSIIEADEGEISRSMGKGSYFARFISIKHKYGFEPDRICIGFSKEAIDYTIALLREECRLS